MDWQELLRNKWMIGGVVVAAGAGLVVLIRKRGSGGGSVGSGAQESPAYSGGVGGFDSSGTDVAHWVGSEMERYDARFAELVRTQEELQRLIDGMANEAPATPKPITPRDRYVPPRVPSPTTPPRAPVPPNNPLPRW